MSAHHSQPATPLVLKIALPLPLRELFDYLPPANGELVQVGARVLVPFGPRQLVGIVVAAQAESSVSQDKLLPVKEVLDQGQAVLDGNLLSLMQWCWQYYKHAPGDVLQAALPPALRKAKGKLPDAPLQYRLTDTGKARLALGAGRAVAQYAVLDRLNGAAKSAEQLESELNPTPGAGHDPELAAGADSELNAELPRWRAILKKVMEQGWVAAEALQLSPAPTESSPELTAEQERVIEDIQASKKGYACHLLDGVTGSGKTEVYLQLLEPVLQSGQQALVLVPEIGLTPQLIRRFHRRLGLPPAVMHSALSAGERLNAWDAARTGRARLLIGTRSALFTPMPRLGMIVLDEEHDASFKQQDGFRYSARDVAVKRAADLGIPVVLGSATPSLESLNNAAAGRYQHHRLRQRATKASMPSWRVLDMRQQVTASGLASAAVSAIAETLERGEQAMVFLNRRGYAPVLMCGQCGWHGHCQRCETHMTWHRSQRRLSCHHCGNEKPVPRFCPVCRADDLVGIGEGTQQLEAGLRSRFPDTTIWRFDRDSTRGKGVMEEQIGQVRNGLPCILVGTQMLAKGHHFPAVTLVVVVNADQALYSADYRALERLGQTLLQVAGRAGRAEKPGSVLLQTFEPQSHALQLLITKGYEDYADWLLEDRRMAGLPPLSYQAQLKAEAVARDDVVSFLKSAANCFPSGQAQLWGPIPALMEKVAGRYRLYLLAQANSRAELHRQLDAWMEALKQLRGGRKVRWVIDVDPQEM